VRRNILCLLSSLFCLHAWGQQAPELNEVVVTATRIESPALESPSAISVVSSADIAASGAHDLATVIAAQSGVVVNDYGPQGSTKSVSLRGSTSSQVLVLVDGIRLNSSRDGMVDFSLVPLENIDRVEIVRGGSSTMYGTGAIGGVINIITKKARKPAISLNVANGSFIPHAASEVSPSMSLSPAALNVMDLADSQNVDISLAGRLGEIGITGGGSFGRAANQFSWFDTSAGGINTWRRRTNADVLSGSAYAGVTSPFLEGELAAKGAVELSDVGSPGSLTLISTTARQGDTAASGSLSWKADRFLVDALTLDVKGFYRYDRLTFNDPTYPPESVHTTHTASFDLTQKLTVSDLLAPVYGGSASFDSVDSTNFASPHQRLNVAAFLSVPISPTDNLTITPTARYDYFSDFSGSLSYSLGAVLLLSNSTSLRASAGSAYRVPTLNDLYWYDPLGFTAANPNLRPETSYNGEVGLSAEGERFSAGVSLFVRYVLDNIVWLASPPLFVYQPENLTKTLFPGAELNGRIRISDGLAVEAGYTFLYSFLLNDGTSGLSVLDDRRVPYTPVHTLSVQVKYSANQWEITFKQRYVSAQFTDSANSQSKTLGGYFVADASGRFSVSDVLAISLAAKNMFNALFYTQLGYPMPPFSMETMVQVRL
jgi:vitamin B12 transporter